mgnify:CR=1 FL=1
MKRRLKPWVKYTLITILTVGLVTHYIWYMNDLSVRREEYSRLVRPVIEVEALEDSPVKKDRTTETDVYFTNYHLGDGSSGTTTASGYQIKDFEVNEDSMYTYDGKVVVATANMTRLPRNIAEGYRSHELYEEFTIRLNGKEYKSVVLDICGKCYYAEGEFLQRYDIFTTGNVIGKVVGQVILTEGGE